MKCKKAIDNPQETPCGKTDCCFFCSSKETCVEECLYSVTKSEKCEYLTDDSEWLKGDKKVVKAVFSAIVTEEELGYIKEYLKSMGFLHKVVVENV